MFCVQARAEAISELTRLGMSSPNLSPSSRVDGPLDCTRATGRDDEEEEDLDQEQVLEGTDRLDVADVDLVAIFGVSKLANKRENDDTANSK